MKTKIIKLGDGCNLTVTIIDRQGMPLKLATLKSLVISLVSDRLQNLSFVANSDNTLTIALTYASNLTKTGMYQIRVEGELSDGQAFDYTEQIIEVKDLPESTETTFITLLVLRDVHNVTEKEIQDVNYKELGYEAFSPFKAYATDDVVVFGGSLYKFTANKSAGIWNASKVETTTVADSAGEKDYTKLTNKPSINGVELSGNKTGAQLGLVDQVPILEQPKSSMKENIFYDFKELRESVHFILSEPADENILNFWMWKFSTGETLYDIILPEGLAWEYGEEPVFEPNQTYLIIVVRGMAMCISTAGVKRLINGILFGLQNGLPSLRVEELTIARKLDAYIKEGNALTSGAGAPTILPQYNGQEYFDTTNKVWYKASYTGTDPNASAWKQITN